MALRWNTERDRVCRRTGSSYESKQCCGTQRRRCVSVIVESAAFNEDVRSAFSGDAYLHRRELGNRAAPDRHAGCLHIRCARSRPTTFGHRCPDNAGGWWNDDRALHTQLQKFRWEMCVRSRYGRAGGVPCQPGRHTRSRERNHDLGWHLSFRGSRLTVLSVESGVTADVVAEASTARRSGRRRPICAA